LANRVDMRIWWLIMSKSADRSSKISIEDLESALASLRDSTTESKTRLNVHFWNHTVLPVTYENSSKPNKNRTLLCLSVAVVFHSSVNQFLMIQSMTVAEFKIMYKHTLGISSISLYSKKSMLMNKFVFVNKSFDWINGSLKKSVAEFRIAY